MLGSAAREQSPVPDQRFAGHRPDVTQSVGGSNRRAENGREKARLSATNCYSSRSRAIRRYEGPDGGVTRGCDATKGAVRKMSNGRATRVRDRNITDTPLALASKPERGAATSRSLITSRSEHVALAAMCRAPADPCLSSHMAHIDSTMHRQIVRANDPVSHYREGSSPRHRNSPSLQRRLAIGRICLIPRANIHKERETPDRTLSLA